jgi:hypothetical protein
MHVKEDKKYFYWNNKHSYYGFADTFLKENLVWLSLKTISIFDYITPHSHLDRMKIRKKTFTF